MFFPRVAIQIKIPIQGEPWLSITALVTCERPLGQVIHPATAHRNTNVMHRCHTASVVFSQ